jgi:hypothetical protein
MEKERRQKHAAQQVGPVEEIIGRSCRPLGVNASAHENATVSQKKCSVARSTGRRKRTDAPTTIPRMPTSAIE